MFRTGVVVDLYGWALDSAQTPVFARTGMGNSGLLSFVKGVGFLMTLFSYSTVVTSPDLNLDEYAGSHLASGCIQIDDVIIFSRFFPGPSLAHTHCMQYMIVLP